MKKITIAFLLFLLAGTVNGQNSLPASGNVGIGIATPTFNLGGSSTGVHVLGVSSTYATVNLQRSNNGQGSLIDFTNAANGLQFRIGTNYFSGGDKFHIASGAISKIGFTMDDNCNIGIGTTSPSQKLTVVNDGAYSDARVLFSNSNNSHLQFLTGNGSGSHGGGNVGNAMIDFRQGRDLLIGASSDESLTSRANYLVIRGDNGNVGIGTSSPAEKLSVNGSISAQKIKVTQLGWSDYVFNKEYKLRSLSSLEYFIKQNKHLPDVPSAREVEENGISVGDNQAMLLKKIEELTLYVIDLKKESITQQIQINQLKRKRSK